jgi:plasmid stabilization system protein ParE
MILIYHPLFKEDLQQAVEHHNLQREGLGDELCGEVELIIRKIAKNPELYPKTYQDVRRARLKRFKWYAVRYQLVAPDTLYILSVLHGARHPSIGKNRT